jgi:hypothetical protein
MPVERRLRNGLAHNAGALDPDVGRLFEAARSRARRRVIMRRAAAGLAAAVAVAAVIVGGPRAVHAIGGLGGPAPPVVSGHHRGVGMLSGTFTNTVPPGSTAIRGNHLAGRWTIRLRGDTIEPVTAPPAFTGVLSAYQFQVRGGTFRTNLFIQDVCANRPVGVYRWARSGRTLRFAVVSDRCRARVVFFTSGGWRAMS